MIALPKRCEERGNGVSKYEDVPPSQTAMPFTRQTKSVPFGVSKAAEALVATRESPVVGHSRDRYAVFEIRMRRGMSTALPKRRRVIAEGRPSSTQAAAGKL